jgi:hypothetical protein
MPLPSVKIQIMGAKVGLRCKGKTLLGDVNKLFVFSSADPKQTMIAKNSNVFSTLIWWA